MIGMSRIALILIIGTIKSDALFMQNGLGCKDNTEKIIYNNESGQLSTNSKGNQDCDWTINLPEGTDAIILNIYDVLISCQKGYLRFLDKNGKGCGICQDGNDLISYCQVYVKEDTCNQDEIWDEISTYFPLCTKSVVHNGLNNLKLHLVSIGQDQREFTLDYQLFKCKGANSTAQLLRNGPPLIPNPSSSTLQNHCPVVLPAETIKPQTTKATDIPIVSSIQQTTTQDKENLREIQLMNVTEGTTKQRFVSTTSAIVVKTTDVTSFGNILNTTITSSKINLAKQDATEKEIQLLLLNETYISTLAPLKETTTYSNVRTTMIPDPNNYTDSTVDRSDPKMKNPLPTKNQNSYTTISSLRNSKAETSMDILNDFKVMNSTNYDGDIATSLLTAIRVIPIAKKLEKTTNQKQRLNISSQSKSSMPTTIQDLKDFYTSEPTTKESPERAYETEISSTTLGRSLTIKDEKKVTTKLLRTKPTLKTPAKTSKAAIPHDIIITTSSPDREKLSNKYNTTASSFVKPQRKTTINLLSNSNILPDRGNSDFGMVELLVTTVASATLFTRIGEYNKNIASFLEGQSDTGQSGLEWWWILVIIVSSLILIGTFCLAIIIWIRRKKQKKYHPPIDSRNLPL